VNQKQYSDQLLTQYLFGDLSEQETEQLDELSISDDELAVRLQVLENDLVDAYVNGELSGPTLARFTSYYLASPARREKVGLARGFQTLLDRTTVAEQDKGQGLITEAKQPAGRKGFLYRYLFVPKPAFQGALIAAMVLLLATGGWLIYKNLRLQNDAKQAQSQQQELKNREQELQAELAKLQGSSSAKEQELAELRQQLAELEQQASATGTLATPPTPSSPAHVVSFALAPQLRSSGQLANLSIPKATDSVSLQLELEPNDFTAYRAELKAQPDNTIVWRSARLRARPKGNGKAVQLALRAALLKAQRYVIELYGVSPTGASEIIGSYPFSVVKP
jgi:hypothetical protein